MDTPLDLEDWRARIDAALRATLPRLGIRVASVEKGGAFGTAAMACPVEERTGADWDRETAREIGEALAARIAEQLMDGDARPAGVTVDPRRVTLEHKAPPTFEAEVMAVQVLYRWRA
ncbi:hypothetical protein K8I61_17570 [bacterium]|nr:hypothetical protein [bacterium]